MIADPLEHVLQAEAQKFDEAHRRLTKLDLEAIGKKIHLLGVQLHHVERIEEQLHDKKLHIVHELNKLLGNLTGKEKYMRTLYREAKGQAAGKKTLAGIPKKDARVALTMVKKDVVALRKVRETIVGHCKRNIRTEEMIAKEAGRK
jgi:hypothetical protein